MLLKRVTFYLGLIIALLLSAGVPELHALPISVSRVAPLGVGPHTPSVTVTYPTGSVRVGEGNDFATMAWANPWDMDDIDDLYRAGSAACGNPYPYYNNTDVQNGLWTGTVAQPDAPIWLVNPSFATGALHMGRDGYTHKIDAGRYFRVSFRMKIDFAPGGSRGHGRFWYTDSGFETNGDLNHWTWSKEFQVFPDNQWHIYIVDLRALSAGQGTLPWTAGRLMTGLALDPGMAPGAHVAFDWFRLSGEEAVQTVNWTGSYGNGAFAEIGLGNGADGFVPVHVFDPGILVGNYYAPVIIPAADGTYTVRGGLAGGQYDVRVRVTDGSGTGTSPVAGPYVVDPAGYGRFVYPAFEAGTDWRDDTSGNPWDMDTLSSRDVTTVVGGSSEYLNLGGFDVFRSVSYAAGNPCQQLGDLQFKLRMQSLYIPTQEYHWLTMRMWVDGTPDIGLGSVARVSWWQQNENFDNCGMSNDILLEDGWTLYSFDLSRGDVLEPESPCNDAWLNGMPSNQVGRFRIDPTESPLPTSVLLDYVWLAKDVRVSTTVPIQWLQSGVDSESALLNLYYDNDLDPFNGKTALVTGSGGTGPGVAAPAPVGVGLGSNAPVCTTNCIYIPVAMNLALSSLCNNNFCSYTWNTGSVPNGSYYLYVETSDGYSSIGRYSDTPVVVQH